MLRVSIDQAQPGMSLARSVFDPDKPSHTLLKPGYKLVYEDIKRLNKLNIRCLWVNYPNLDFLDDLIDPVLTQMQSEVCDCLKSQFASGEKICLARVDYHQYTKKMSAMFSHMVNHQGLSALFINELYGASEDLFQHGTTVAYLSMLIGMKLEGYLIQQRSKLPKRMATDLTSLGTGCLLHDLGKITLPEELQDFKLSAQDMGDPEWQNHTEAGFEMVQGGLDSAASQVVLNHHQHFDGSGFPKRKCSFGSGQPDTPLSGEDIHIFCRIASLADRFDRFRQGPNGQELPSVVALKRLRNPGYVKWFDPMVYDAFLETIPPFPPGLQVTLNNAQTCVVKEVNLKNPCRPFLCPIDLDFIQNVKMDVQSEPLPDISLENQSSLHIVKVGHFEVVDYLY